ncbi:MRC1-like domain-containing protein [Jackrogersella minutella]|nr:MRC1-like domain-containing protein [Jackrogersella minutella]
MASTRSPSPVEGTSAPTSPQLSPRSKIKALLATVNDAESDDESSGPIDPKTLFKSIEKTTTNNKPKSTQNSEETDGEEEEEIVRPRGRLAGRMRTNDKDTTNDIPSNLQKESTKPHSASANGNEDNGESANTGDEEEEVVSTIPRRRLARPARHATPDVTEEDTGTLRSPGLFVTPAPETSVALRQSALDSDTDDELPENLGKSERFMALVAKKRQERLAKEAEEERKKKERAERMAEQIPAESDVDDDVSDISDDDGGRKLTQDVSRPARKASKKALEEMNRETQRISRSLQLAHEAKTKKKITKASLFERFNFRTEAAPSEAKPTSSSRPTTPGSMQQTDVDMGDAGTPPSSPPVALKTIQDAPATPTAPITAAALNDVFGEDDELPSLETVIAQKEKEDKGKGKAMEPAVEIAETKKATASKPKRQVRVKLPPIQANLVTIDSDDELEITNSKKGRMDAIFNKIPTKTTQESKSMHVLRHLAHLSSPTRDSSRGRNSKPSMTPAELQMSLQQRARAQAKLERERRLEFLRSKGITVQTEEERHREREQVEDIVARARQEVEEIMQREREDAKKARKEKRENGENDPLAWDDDSDDDSYEESEKETPAEIELSGSEEENEEEEDDEMEYAGNGDVDEPAANLGFEDEAEVDGDSEEERTPKPTKIITSDDEEDALPAVKSRRPKKHVQIVSDDEDEVEATPKPKTKTFGSPSFAHTSSPKIPTSVLRSATKTFIPGLPVPLAGPAGLGLTQIFAGTMDDSQVAPGSGSPLQYAPTFDNFPDSQFSATAGQSQNAMILDSQNTQNPDTQARETQTQGVQLHFSQTQVHGFDSLMQTDATQMSDLIEPTQDGGFQDFTPLKQRFVDAPQSTVDTLVDGTPDYEAVQNSPLMKKRGKLRRRGESRLSLSTLPDIPGSPSVTPSAPQQDDARAAASAFRIMEKAARRKKRLQEKFDKKKSKATEMIEEQAEESEDEYAGLGGADGEASSEEDDEFVKEMIDDAAGNDANNEKLAGFFADKERAADAAQVDKLFRDITTGMLRKRRRGGGNDFDLSDSDDGGEARRRMKRRQFAKMQKALFADERIGKIAENPRNAAFLKSIEDRNSDDEWDFDQNFADSAPESESESQGQSQGEGPSAAAEKSIPDSQPMNGGLKRAHEDDHAPRPPPNARRTKAGARASSLTDVRKELSNLLDEPHGSATSIVPATEIGSDSEDEERQPASSSSSNKENQRPEVAVVDRIKLKRDSSSSSTNGAAGSSRLAFAAPSASGGLFKVPALLRRATTNSIISNSSAESSSGSSSGLSKMAAGGKDDGSKLLKKTAGKRSGINYFARENERRAAVADAEKRREAKKWKGVEGRGKVVGGLFGGGRFE